MPTSNFQPIRLLDPDCCCTFTYLMANSADPDQLATVCKGRVYLGSAGQGLRDGDIYVMETYMLWEAVVSDVKN